MSELANFSTDYLEREFLLETVEGTSANMSLNDLRAKSGFPYRPRSYYINGLSLAENAPLSRDDARREFFLQELSALNLMSFGAVGDGVADDTEALQEAISAAIDSQKSLFVPSGTYMIQSMTVEAHLYDSQSLTIYGEGETSVIKRLPQSALDNNQRMIYIRGLGHADKVVVKNLKIDGNARENPLPEGNLDPYLWQQNHSILISDSETVGSINEVHYENLVVDDSMADGLSFAGRSIGSVVITGITVPTRNRTRSDIQFSRPVGSAQISDCNVKSLEMEWVSQPQSPMTLIVNDVVTENLDLGAASLGLNCFVELTNVTAGALAAFRGIQGEVRDCTLSIIPGSSNEIRSSNGLKFINCTFQLSSSLLLVHGGGTDAVTAPIFEDCEFVGSAPVVGITAGLSATGSISATVRRCIFSGSLTNSIKADRSGLIVVDDCRLIGTTEALHMTATGGVKNRLEWNSGPNSKVTATSPIRVNSATVDLELVLTGIWAWGEHRFSGQVPLNVESTRLIYADAVPTGMGILGDTVRLRNPVAGQPFEWIATTTSASNAGWQVSATAPA